ncbi:MAG: prealbumin-like fold domain-containing protein, partial [Oscillospiraceae bacterium]|nr:prealbumin-like fold domain-containing protein [Oscillospiraceae bacterium]
MNTKAKVGSRILCAALGLTMLFALLPALTTPARAAWDGTADTNWYINGASPGYEIFTEADLVGLAQLSNLSTTTVDVEVVWEDTNLTISGSGGNVASGFDFTSDRPSDIEFVLRRSPVTAEDGWATTEPIRISASDSWQKTISQVIPAGETQAVDLPLNNSRGAEFTYEAAELTGLDSAYTWAGTTAGNSITITNTLKTTDISFTTLGADTNAPLEGATFRLTGAADSGMSFAVDATSGADGVITFSGLPVGFYHIQEYAAPT